MAPAITVGMPIYNGESLLATALDSLAKQTFRDFDVLISDNASTDASLDIARSFAERDERFRLYEQPENMGMVANFQFVLDHASSEYFCWRAYDDRSDPDWLERLYASLQARPSCELSVSTVQRLNPDGSNSKLSLYVPLDGESRLHRVTAQMRSSRAPWIYGLFRRDALARHFNAASTGFEHDWAKDHATLLSLILEDKITGAADTVFYQHRVPTDDNFRPLELRARWRHWFAFVRYSLRVWRQSSLGPGEKAICLLFLPAYVNRKGAKLSRLLRATLAWPFQRLRSVDSVQGGHA